VGGEKIFRKKIVEKDSIPVSTIQKALKILYERAIVNRENNIYSFYDVFFERWLNKHFYYTN
jgi:hypothetical protein